MPMLTRPIRDVSLPHRCSTGYDILQPHPRDDQPQHCAGLDRALRPMQALLRPARRSDPGAVLTRIAQDDTIALLADDPCVVAGDQVVARQRQTGVAAARAAPPPPPPHS